MSVESSEAAVAEVVIGRVFDAPRERVFAAWTDPKRMARWWGPHEFTNPVCELDPRPGGAILIHMRGPDGTVYPMTGTFQEVVPPERLSFTTNVLMDDAGTVLMEGLTIVTFAARGDQTELTVRASITKAAPEAAGAIEGMDEGWTQSLDRLETELAHAR